MRYTILLGFGLATASPSFAAETITYIVRGSSAADLIAQMKTYGPNGYWAWTQANYNWTYTFQRSGGRCRIESATVTERITVTMPEWQNRSGGKNCLRERWDRMLAKLTEHEMGHVSRWSGTRERIRATLVAMPANPSCEALGKAANAAGSAEIGKTQTTQEAYDRQTNHGLATGVALPEC